jgi:hypothetical protein
MMDMRNLRRAVLAACCALAYLLLTRAFAPRMVTATSPNGRFTARVHIGQEVPISIVDNQRGRPVPFHSSRELDTLLHQASGAGSPFWQGDSQNCSFLVTTGDTRKDRIVWLHVSGEPREAEVTALEPVDD